MLSCGEIGSRREMSPLAGEGPEGRINEMPVIVRMRLQSR